MSETLNPQAAWPFPTKKPESETAERELPRYLCHKQVWALKIAGAEQIVRPSDGAITGYRLSFAEPGYAPIEVTAEWVRRTDLALIGGYYVVYADGYTSFSPAKAFEEGYTLATESDRLTLPVRQG